MLTNNKVWGTNLGKRGSKSGILGWKSGFLLSAAPMVLDVPGNRGLIRTFLNASFDAFDCCFHS